MEFRIELVEKNGGEKYYTAYEIGHNERILGTSAGVCNTIEEARKQCHAYWERKTSSVTVVDRFEIN